MKKSGLAATVLLALTAAAANPFSIGIVDGVPTLLKNGKPTSPVWFWQHLPGGDEVNRAKEAGIEVFTFFNSKQSYEHPYWVGPGKYDFSWHDEQFAKFFAAHPDVYVVPRIFVPAPYWWLEQHPDECIGFVDNPPKTRGNGGGSTFHESFASELWKKEQGEALRAFIRHIKSMPWGDRVIGIHVTGGTLGEWHIWSGGKDPDCSPAMTRRYGRPIPPAMERDADYFECFFAAEADAIEHFCRIVKEESDYLTLAFYGYFMANESPYSQHKGLDRLLRMKSVDIICSPHVYARRAAGDDGYFRAFPASLAKHGKLFFDESDDRTEFAASNRNKWDGGWVRGRTEQESVSMLRREFGQAVTNCVGLWYMDIDPGMFNRPSYWKEIGLARKWYDRQLSLSQRRVSEIAVICDDYGRIGMPRDQFLKPIAECAVRKLTFGAINHIGAPFDFYTSGDLDYETLSKYKVVILLDGVALTDRLRAEFEKLKSDGRALVWFHGSGAYDPAAGKFDMAGMRKLTGMDFAMVPSQQIPWSVFERPEETKPGFSPLESHADFKIWSSHYFGGFAVSSDKLRAVCRDAGVFIYSDEGDVLSASESALMVHASSDGIKHIRLPRPKNVTDMATGKSIGSGITEFEVMLNVGDTAVFELAPADKQ